MTASDLRHAVQVTGEGQLAEHQDRLHHVMIDDVALLAGQRAARDAQVVKLAAVVFPGRYIELEAPWVVRRDQFGRVALEQVFGLVCQQRLSDR
ncbi:hypothetical protein D3C84_1017580 [compost metagenome]